MWWQVAELVERLVNLLMRDEGPETATEPEFGEEGGEGVGKVRGAIEDKNDEDEEDEDEMILEV